MTEPTDAELDELRQANSGRLNFVTLSEFRTIARAVLAKWGTPPAVAGEPECTCSAKDMPFGTCCKVRSAFERWYDEQNDGRLQPFDVFKGGWIERHRLSSTPQPAPSAAVEVKLEPVYGDVLPPVGSRVFIRHGFDNDAHACIVTGYYAWGDLGGNKRLHRVFVRMVYEGTTTEQARRLCDCYPTSEAALAARKRGENHG